ncbi:MAG: hypothetical protein MUO73_03140, partial [Thermoplasmata archaeon]|nr:hypothetical protein [Thermoplasmata archaeon]
MKERKIIFWKAAVAITIALVFVMPGSTVCAYYETTESEQNSEQNNTPVTPNAILTEYIPNETELDDGSTNVITDEIELNHLVQIIDMNARNSRGTIYVDDNNTAGPWNGTIEHPYQHIQDGVNASTNGDTVYVYTGSYAEHVRVNKTINLIGQNRDTVIINGTGTGKVLYITANYVNVSYFTITRGQYGIHLNSASYCTFTECKVIDNKLSSGAWGFCANNANFTRIIGGNYSRNGNTGNNQHGYNIYFTMSQNVTIDGASVYEPVQGAKPPTCPILYSWDGSKFTFEGDSSINGGMGFRNVIEQKAQPFDYTVIKDLEPQEGAYKFVVCEEQKEISYFDSAKLLVIDHEPGVSIFSPTPIYIGDPQIENPVKIHTVKDPQP